MTRFGIAVLLGGLLALGAACSGSSTTDEAETTEETMEKDAPTEESTEASTQTETETTQTEEEVMPETRDPSAPENVAAPPADATTTESGLAYKILEEGEGDETPTPTSTVTVHYTGWTTDGVKFDSSRDRGKPATFPLDKVIPGWTEGVSMMKVGENRRLWIPSELAYNNRPGRPQGMLVFDVELIEIVEK